MEGMLNIYLFSRGPLPGHGLSDLKLILFILAD
jgi:hypothetical protein